MRSKYVRLVRLVADIEVVAVRRKCGATHLNGLGDNGDFAVGCQLSYYQVGGVFVSIRKETSVWRDGNEGVRNSALGDSSRNGIAEIRSNRRRLM